MSGKQERSKSLAPASRKQAFRRSMSEVRRSVPAHPTLLEPLDQRRIHQQLLRVYLRIRPFQGASQKSRSWLEQCPPTTVLVNRSALPSAPARAGLPSSRSAADIANAGPGTGTEPIDGAGAAPVPVPASAAAMPSHMEFRFRRILSERATQLQVFRTVGEAALRQLYTGGSGLILVTGAGGSGKTYTLLGAHSRETIEGGLLHRCLNAIFRSAGCEFVDRCLVQADESGTGFRLIPSKKAQELAADANRTLQGSEFSAASEKQRTGCLWQMGGVKILTNRRRHACFLGVLMVHEGAFYDLLGEQTATEEKRPPAVVLREDKRGRAYAVKGSRLEISSVEEAEVLIRTALNRRCLWTGSGRSHLIVNIYLAIVEGTPKEPTIDCGQLTLVEVLAPQTEVQKTKRPCDALKTDYTLKMCLSALQANQLAILKGKSQRKRAPNRESSLTQFLRHFFDVAQPASVVCVATVSLDPRQIVESVRALRFAEETVNVSPGQALRDEPSIITFLEESIEPFGVAGQVFPTFLDKNIRPDYKAIRTVKIIEIPAFEKASNFVSQLKGKHRRRRNLVQLSKELAVKLLKQFPGKDKIFGLQETAIKEVEQRIKEMEPLIARLEKIKTPGTYGQLAQQAQEAEKRAQVSENLMNARNQQLEHHMALKERNGDLEMAGDGRRRGQKEKRLPIWHYY
ncbi:uncharacterized protein Dana_GF27767 [Drosophila ananassae]|uniref:Kinesin motor domain-containing protein n=1 Tax=Drosophila ananassae TaxID=7217 RepID=A0A0P8XKD7_DROAN|nr:kinesin-like protein KIF23 [Drosophila ananassae]KPU75213.1 uncharacterized protein Dana_GF27767 [Drosophila ananassae]